MSDTVAQSSRCPPIRHTTVLGWPSGRLRATGWERHGRIARLVTDDEGSRPRVARSEHRARPAARCLYGRARSRLFDASAILSRPGVESGAGPDVLIPPCDWLPTRLRVECQRWSK